MTSTIKKMDKVLLIFGGSFYFLIGLYHIFLPYIWNWSEFTASMPDMIEWGVYAINFLMSCMMVLLGIMTFQYALFSSKRIGNRSILIVCLVFWILNFGYQIILPTPIPPEMNAMKIGFLVPPALGILAYGIPLFRRARP